MKEDYVLFSTLRKFKEVLSKYTGNKDKYLVLGDFNLYYPA